MRGGEPVTRAVTRIVAAGAAAVLLAGCAGAVSSPSASPAPAPERKAQTPATKAVDASQAQRLQRLMPPLIQAMNRPRPLKDVKVGLIDDPHVNAANAGNGEFLVTTGLLEKADDAQLQAVLAHEVAHEDLGHVAKAQLLGTGLNIGMVILDQIIPGSGAITPIAGQLIMNRYTRTEEYAADRHGAELLEKIGHTKQQMIDTLTWLVQTEGGSKGGFFSTHPATAERIEALRQMK